MATKKIAAKKAAAKAGAAMQSRFVRLKVGAAGGKLTREKIASAINSLTDTDMSKIENSTNLFLADGSNKRPM